MVKSHQMQGKEFARQFLYCFFAIDSHNNTAYFLSFDNIGEAPTVKVGALRLCMQLRLNDFGVSAPKSFNLLTLYPNMTDFQYFLQRRAFFSTTRHIGICLNESKQISEHRSSKYCNIYECYPRLIVYIELFKSQTPWVFD